jgi:glycosyltransferase involved in cell wall biosynthesis
MFLVYNGYDFSDYDLSNGTGEYLVFLGRMNAKKNPLDAIRIASAVGLPIMLAGAPETDLEQLYFDTEIKPHVDGQRVRYIGRVNTGGKRDLFKNAAALLFPVRWDEPFGLVMIEAMANGVPVLAYKRGAVPEVIDPGITGFYADSVEEIVSLVPKALALDRSVIREHGFARFNHDRMIDEYVAVLESVAGDARN